MILSEYEAKRAELDRRLQEVGEREAAHKMELSVKYQAECKRIQSQIGQLKKKQKELLKKYAVEIPHVEILPPDFGELKNIQMDGSALKINIQFKIKPQNPKEL